MLIGVYGAGGHGREALPWADIQAAPKGEAIFIDDNVSGRVLNGHRVMTWAEFLHASDEDKRVCVAIGNSATRERLVNRCVGAGCRFTSIRAANAIILDNVMIGEGAILSPFVLITSNIRIGKHFHANMCSYVTHDCVIGDFVTFAPSVCCNGNVIIEDHAYIGTGAMLKQGSPSAPLVIGKGAVVGMGAVVTKSVPAGVTVVGNPARPLAKD